MWIYRDTNGKLMLSNTVEPPIYDEDNERWIVDRWNTNPNVMELFDDDIYDCDDFDEITIENSPVEYELIRSNYSA